MQCGVSLDCGLCRQWVDGEAVGKGTEAVAEAVGHRAEDSFAVVQTAERHSAPNGPEGAREIPKLHHVADRQESARRKHKEETQI